jgi:nucleotide-binding universal stress UspA family protein
MPAGIVLGYDDSAGARTALAVAADLASRLSEPLWIAFGSQPATLVGEESRTLGDAIEERGRELVDDAVRTAEAAGVQVEAHIARERPVDLLVRLADELDARLVVVGSYADSPLRGAILGSTPHKLLHVCDRPVLAVPASGPG